MSGWFVAFDATAPVTDACPAAVATELVRYPHDASGRVDHACGTAAQALRRYTARDAAAVLPAAADGLVLVGDLRLDETAALAALLGLPPGASDPDLVLAAYRRFGADGLAAHLLGDFAFAVVDEAARTLVLVRDPMGVRPLYVARLGSLVLASSDVAVLAEHPGVDTGTDERVLVEWILYGHVWHPTRTFFRGVAKVPRATRVVVTAAGSREHVWWRPPPLAPLPREQVVAELARLVPAAVACRVSTAHPVAAHNSGGFDSGVLATLTGRIAAEAGIDAWSYNWAKPEPGSQSPAEWEPARRIAAAAGMHHVEVGFTEQDAMRILAEHDITRQGTAMFEYETKVLAHAAERGVRQIVSGWGGDELVTSQWLPSLAQQVRSGQVRQAWRRYSASRTRGPAGRALRFGPAVVRDLVRWSPPGGPYDTVSRRRDLALPLVEGRPDVGSRGLQECEAPIRHFLRAASDREHQVRALDLGHLVERTESWAAQGRRAGVRHLYPLLDLRLVERLLCGADDPWPATGRARYESAVALAAIAPATLVPKGEDVERVALVLSGMRTSVVARLDGGGVGRLPAVLPGTQLTTDDLLEVSTLRDALLAQRR